MQTEHFSDSIVRFFSASQSILYILFITYKKMPVCELYRITDHQDNASRTHFLLKPNIFSLNLINTLLAFNFGKAGNNAPDTRYEPCCNILKKNNSSVFTFQLRTIWDGSSPFWSCSCVTWRISWPLGSRFSSPSGVGYRTKLEPPPSPWRAALRSALSPLSWAWDSKKNIVIYYILIQSRIQSG